MENKDLKFAFFGTGKVAVNVLEKLYENGYVPELIVTPPDKPKGRKMILTPPLAKVWAEEHNIPVTQPVKLNSEFISSHFPPSTFYSLSIVAEYGKLIPKEILDTPKHGTLNVHPSLLPKFRGPSPIKSFILSGEEKTGTTIILLDEEMDHGPVLAQQVLKAQSDCGKRCDLEEQSLSLNLNAEELTDKLSKLGGQMLVDIIPDWIEGKIKAQEQDHPQATVCQKINKKDGLITWDEPVEEIEKKIRAFTPWPGAYFFVKKNDRDFRIIIVKAEVQNNKLNISRIKPEGKNEMPIQDFLRGNQDIAEQLKQINKISF